MTEIEVTIKKGKGSDITRKMVYKDQEDIINDAPLLLEFLKYYTFI